MEFQLFNVTYIAVKIVLPFARNRFCQTQDSTSETCVHFLRGLKVNGKGMHSFENRVTITSSLCTYSLRRSVYILGFVKNVSRFIQTTKGILAVRLCRPGHFRFSQELLLVVLQSSANHRW